MRSGSTSQLCSLKLKSLFKRKKELRLVYDEVLRFVPAFLVVLVVLVVPSVAGFWPDDFGFPVSTSAPYFFAASIAFLADGGYMRTKACTSNLRLQPA